MGVEKAVAFFFWHIPQISHVNQYGSSKTETTMSDSDDVSAPPDPLTLLNKELPPPPTNAPKPLAGHQYHLEHVASTPTANGQERESRTEADEGAVITVAESFWPSVDSDDSDTLSEDLVGSPRKRYWHPTHTPSTISDRATAKDPRALSKRPAFSRLWLIDWAEPLKRVSIRLSLEHHLVHEKTDLV